LVPIPARKKFLEQIIFFVGAARGGQAGDAVRSVFAFMASAFRNEAKASSRRLP
jgi:hypothetical protein